MANVYKPNKGWMVVKNLGWLLRHASEVETIGVYQSINQNREGFMVVSLKHDMTYITDWASLKICRRWLKRPSLRGKRLFWINHWTTTDAPSSFDGG